MNKLKKVSSIYTRLTLGFIFTALLPLLAIAIFVLWSVTNYSENRVSQGLEQIVSLVAPEFGNVTQHAITELKVLTQSDVFELDDDFNISKYLNEATAESLLTKKLFYFSPLGQARARSGSISRTKLTYKDLGISDELFEQALAGKQGDGLFTKMVIDENHINKFYTLSPVTDDSNLRVIGVLVSELSLAVFDSLFSRLDAQLGNVSDIYLTDRFNTRITGLQKVPVENTATLDQALDHTEKDELNIYQLAATSITANHTIYSSEASGRELIVYLNLKSFFPTNVLDWVLVTRVPYSIVTAPAKSLAKSIIGIVIVVACIALVTGLLVARSFGQPIKHLSNMALSMADNKSNSRMEPLQHGPKELVLLSQAFSDAIGQIASRTHDLEMAKLAAENALKKEERANEARGSFLAIMSHEIRTPLNGILGVVQLLELNPDLTEKQKEYLRLARTAGESLLQILTDVLDLSKIESEAFELQKVDFKVSDIITPVLSIFRQTASSSVVIHQNDLVPGNMFLQGDLIRIRQIVWNLMSNAVKFTPKGTVTVQSSFTENKRENRSDLTITISDTGVGIEEEKQKLILEPFMQADISVTRSFEGVGLGLAIVKRLLTAMGGDLTIIGKPGIGTVVSVNIPVKSIPQAENSTHDAAQDLVNNTAETEPRPITAVVVDDNSLNALVAADMLIAAGIQTFTANSGMQALEILEKRTVDVVILDQHMPIMDGISTATAIKQHDNPQISQIKIIGLTADARPENKKAMQAAGMSLALIKPVQRSALLMALKNILPQNLDEATGA